MTRDAPLAFRITRQLKAALLELAAADRRSLSQYVELVLEKHVSDQRPPEDDQSARSEKRPKKR
jgi:hypothetical protein